MKNVEKALLCVAFAFVAGLLSGNAADFGGLWFVIVPVVIVTIAESILSLGLASGNSKTALWFGLLFHLVAAAVFCAGCYMYGHEILQPFQYTIDYGHGNLDIVTDDSVLWLGLIVPLAFRIVVVETILLIVYAIEREKGRA